MLHPHDLAAVHRDDLDLADVLVGRIEREQGSRELLVAELVAALSVHTAASDAVVGPAVAEHLPDGPGRSSTLAAEHVGVATALTVVETSSGPDADAAISELRRFLDGWSEPGARTSALFADLRDAIGDDGMIVLGRAYMNAKRHAPTRPHPGSTGPLARLAGVIDRVKDASSGRAILAATDGSGILDAESQDVIDALAELGRKPFELLDPEQARHQPAMIDAVNRVVEARGDDVLPPPLARVEDITIATDAGGLAARVFDAHPDSAAARPVVLYVHGGAWVVGDIYAYDSSARGLALAIDAIVVSVGYRLAPEHPFPAAHDDVVAALRWLQRDAGSLGGDPTRIAVVGEGAGASMVVAATVASLRDSSAVPVAQVLINPIVTTTLDTASARSSCREHADAKPLDTAILRWSFGHLLPDATLADDRIELLTLDDQTLAAMPPTLVITAERDPLHDQGVAFAERLKSAGATAALREYAGVPHDFFTTARVVAAARDARAATAALLDTAFRSPP